MKLNCTLYFVSQQKPTASKYTEHFKANHKNTRMHNLRNGNILKSNIRSVRTAQIMHQKTGNV